MSLATYVPRDLDVPLRLETPLFTLEPLGPALDVPLWRSVREWIATDWPFRSVEYAERPG